VKIANCVACKQDHDVQTTTQTASNGRPYVRYTCPTTGRKMTRFVAGSGGKAASPARSTPAPKADVIINTGAGSDVVNVNTSPRRAPRSSGGGSMAGKDCKTIQAFTLHGRPVYNICDADLLPLAKGMVDGLMERARTIAPGHALVASADKAAAPGSCCDESGIDIGAELARVFMEELLRRRVGPTGWVQLMPRELAIAHASGALAQPLPSEIAAAVRGPDATATAIGDGVVTIWERLTGAASGIALGGMRGGAPGAVLGGMAGALFPELVGGAEAAGEWLGQELGFIEEDAEELPLPMPDDYLSPTLAPSAEAPAPSAGGERQMQLVNAQRANQGRTLDLGLSFAGVGINAGIPLRA